MPRRGERGPFNSGKKVPERARCPSATAVATTMPPSVVLAGEGDAPAWLKDNDHPHAAMLLSDLLPSLPVHVSTDGGPSDGQRISLGSSCSTTERRPRRCG